VAKFDAGVVDTSSKFATGIGGAPSVANISANVRTNDPNVIFEGLGEDDS
jgi:hypothetical protein